MPSLPPVRPDRGSTTRRAALAGAGAALALGRGAAAVPVGCGTPPCAFGPTTGWVAARAGLEAILSQSLLPFWRPRRRPARRRGLRAQPRHSPAAGSGRPTGRWSRRRGCSGSSPTAPPRPRGAGRRCARGARLRHPDGAALGPGPWRLLLGGRPAPTTRPSRPDKQLYGQAFALFALSEHALASGSPAAAGRRPTPPSP